MEERAHPRAEEDIADQHIPELHRAATRTFEGQRRRDCALGRLGQCLPPHTSGVDRRWRRQRAAAERGRDGLADRVAEPPDEGCVAALQHHAVSQRVREVEGGRREQLRPQRRDRERLHPPALPACCSTPSVSRPAAALTAISSSGSASASWQAGPATCRRWPASSPARGSAAAGPAPVRPAAPK